MSGLQPGIEVAEASLRGGSPQTALQITNGILARNSGNEAALVVQGDALTMLGRFDDAAASYSHALQRNSQSVGATIGLGRIRLTSDPAAAERLFLDALNHEPRNTAALNDLGVSRDLQGRHVEAQAAYGQALGIDPQLTAAQVNLALSMAMTGSGKGAVDLLRPLASDPGASRKLRHDLAAALTMAGDRAEASHILSADLSPADVEQALNAYAAARSGSAGLLASSAQGDAAPATPVPTTPAATMSAPATPAPATPASHPPASTPVAKASVAPPSRSARTGAADTVQAQLAAASSEDGAQQEWQRLQERMPDLLASHSPEFFKAETNGHSIWRVRTGFADKAQATAFCESVRNAGGPCMVIKP